MKDDIVYKSLLYDFYGELLTDKQNSIIDLYYNHDLTLSEISENTGISRQGVYDTLKRAENALDRYEKKLKLVERFNKHSMLIVEVNSKLEKILNSNIDDVEEIKKKLIEMRNIFKKIK